MLLHHERFSATARALTVWVLKHEFRLELIVYPVHFGADDRK